MVPITYVPIQAPWGVEQKRYYQTWLDSGNFVRHFLRKHPQSPLADKPEVVRLLAPSLGQLAKLEYADVHNIADPDEDYKTDELSPWTPARMKLLELAAKHAQHGEHVLVGSSLVAPGPWVAARLREHGVDAVHIVEENATGRPVTKSPRARAQAVARFRAGEAQVLCVGVHAMSLGHNLDCASIVIVYGLPWDFATWDQFVKRVRRLTSPRPITVYVVIPVGGLTEKKWDRLKDKTAASDLALDGHLSDQNEELIDQAQVLRELQARGMRFDGTEVPEYLVEAAWNNTQEQARDETV
jgi:hypothetical protein